MLTGTAVRCSATKQKSGKGKMSVLKKLASRKLKALPSSHHQEAAAPSGLSGTGLRRQRSEAAKKISASIPRGARHLRTV